MSDKISYQGVPGAYSHLACLRHYPALQPLACESFEEAFSMVATGKAIKAMIPVENTLAGRVADIHYLLPSSNLEIAAEKFLPIQHQLLAKKGAKLTEIKRAHSHIMALGQCRLSLKELNIKPVHANDTAGAAQICAQASSLQDAAVASQLAGEIYGLEVLAANIEDATHNTTRFLVMRQQQQPTARQADMAYMTSFVFEVKNLPGALYKVMGGFATNGINMTKLESYQLGGSFTATRFFCDIVGHPEQANVAQALEEAGFFCKHLRMVGTYLADPFRQPKATQTTGNFDD
ncbi:Prephenate dehydratase [hydrothermal vent metagenome]|uniref:prephenate dehydratase n=1 Tax=hydrothermal vent metagenome TaxID=652676 RepID=A0A3B0R852_9ZZZZ